MTPIPHIIVTDKMNPVQRKAVLHEAITRELSEMALHAGWQLLVQGLEKKCDKLVRDLTSSAAKLDARDEDRKRGELAAYRDVIDQVDKARRRQDRLNAKAAEAANAAKERQHGEAAAV